MPANRILSFVLLLLVLAGAAFWAFAGGDTKAPAPGPGATVEQARGTAGAEGAALADKADPAAAAGTTSEASLERSAVATGATGAPADVPALVGKVVDQNGSPVAGAELCVGKGSMMVAASGRFDFAELDPEDFDEMRPDRIGESSRQQIAELVRTTTAADGSFRVVPKASGRRAWLRVVARGHALLDRVVPSPADHDVDVGALQLTVGAIVRGQVVDGAGNPVAAVTVSRLLDIEKGPMGQFEVDAPEMQASEELRIGDIARSDAAGRFELAHLPIGDFTLRARHPDYPTTRQDGSATAGREVEVLITMPRGAEVRGRVIDRPAGDLKLRVVAAKKAGNNPAMPFLDMVGADPSEFLGDLGVPFGERTADVGPDGEFVLRGLRPQEYRLTLAQVGVGFAGAAICSDRVDVTAPAHGIQLRYEAGVTVTLTVVDAKTGAPVERLWVSHRLRGGSGGFGDFMPMMGGGDRASDFPNGAVTVPNLRPKAKQTLAIELQAVGYAGFERKDIELPRLGTLDLGTIRLDPRPVVQVTVIAQDTGAPVAGAKVRVQTEGRGQRDRWMAMAGMGGGGPSAATTDAQGRCLLNATAADAATISVESADFARFTSEELHFAAEGRSEYMARLLVGGTVEVTVVDEAGKPVAEVSVEQQVTDGMPRRQKTDATGRTRFEHIVPGTHRFRLGGDEGLLGEIASLARTRGVASLDAEPEAPGVEVQDHATVALQLVQQPTAALHGVVRENGVPLAGARVVFVAADSTAENELAEQMMGGMLEQFGKRGSSSKTDENGRYTLSKLPAGAHSVRVTHKDRARPALLPVVLQNGDNTQDFELDMTSVRGVVKDPDGAVVSGARILVRVVKAVPDEADEMEETVGSMMPQGFGNGSSIKSGDDGTFLLRGVEAGVPLRITATSKGLAPAVAVVTAAAGSMDSSVVLQLRAAGRIKVAARGEGPQAVVRARFVGEGERPAPVVQMLRRGKATLEGLLPGTWEVEVHDSEGEHKLTVEVVAGETVDATF